MMIKKRVLACLGLGVSALALGVCLVWINLELVGLSYRIKEVHDLLEGEKELKSKLQVEHMNLLSSYQLRKKAVQMDLQPPKKGQMRIMVQGENNRE
jgi:ABC-type siderophore export system fused ATPase/permease subunit